MFSSRLFKSELQLINQISIDFIYFIQLYTYSEMGISMIAELIVCLTIESHRCGSRGFDRYTAGLHQAMVSM